MFVNMIAVPDELRKKLLACRRIISRLSDWRWDIEHAEALRVEMDSLNAELFDLVPEDEEIPYEIEEKVEHYNVMLDRYIDRLKSGSVSSILNYNVTSLDGLTKSMICSEHMNVSKDSNDAVREDLVNNLDDPNRTILGEHMMNLVDSHESMSNVNAVDNFVVSLANGGHVNNLDAKKNEPEPETSSRFGLRFPSRENCSIEIREKTNELQCSILEFKNESNLSSKFEFFDEVNIMKEAKEIVDGADLAFAKNCSSNYPDFREFMFMFTIMNTNDDDFVYDFLELDLMKTQSDRLVIIGKIFDPYGFDPGKLKFKLLYRLADNLDLVVPFPIMIVEQVINHLKFVNELSDLEMYRYFSANGEIYGVLYVFVSAFGYVVYDIEQMYFVFGYLLYRIHAILSGLFTFWSDSIMNFYRLDSLPSDRDRQVAVLLKKSIKIIYVLNLSKRNVDGLIILAVLFCGNINAKRFVMDLKFFVGYDLIDASAFVLSKVYYNVSILSKKFEFAGQEEDYEKLESIDQLLNFVRCLLPEGNISCHRRTSFYRMAHENVFLDLPSLRIWFTSPLVSIRIDFVLPMNYMIVRRFCGLTAFCIVSRIVYLVMVQFLSAFAVLNVMNLIIIVLCSFLKKIFFVMEYEIRFNEKFWRYQYLLSLCLFNAQKMISFKIDDLVMVLYVLVNRYEWPFFRIFSEDDASTVGYEKFEIFEKVTEMILPISKFSIWNRAGSVTKRDLARFY